MLRMGLDVDILPLPISRERLIRELTLRDFDVLVSNGCPYILPISKLPKKLYINIHPSLLPDLKGKSPILEAISLNKPIGVTCHIMVDEVDSGPIISQIRIEPDRSNLNECYREIFKAEAKVFRQAFNKGFK